MRRDGSKPRKGTSRARNRLSRVAPLVAIALLGAACTSDDDPDRSPSPPPSSLEATTTPDPSPETSEPQAGPPPRLEDAGPCPGLAGFTCSTVTVPLDHDDPTGPKLDLRVGIAAGNADKPVLLFLTGGPGQGGIAFISTVQADLPQVLEDYRLVMVDQRGTGAGALRCDALQEAVGGSDILAPPTPAVRDCARELGAERGSYTTAATVEDLDLLRRAIGVEKWTVDGVSYGSYVAQRYAIAHPDHVRALVLDSVVPFDGFDPFLRPNLRRAAYALSDACAGVCSSDPARDLAATVREGRDDVELLNALTLQSVFDPTFRDIADVPTILREASAGNRGPLEDYLAEAREWGAVAPEELSAGLHIAALCGDLRFPWGDASAPLEGRRAAVRKAIAGAPAKSFEPFDRDAAVGNGILRSCLEWPTVEAATAPVEGDLPDVPVLLLNGERDLSTPIAWARETAAAWPDSRLVVIPNDGHSVQAGGAEPFTVRTVVRFLTKTAGS